MCSVVCCVLFLFFFFKQKTAYEMRISDWSSDVCSSDLSLERLPCALIRLRPSGLVSTGPGHKTLTRILENFSSCAMASEKAYMKVFVPVYIDRKSVV